VDYEKLSGSKVSESSECIRKRVPAARNIQHAGFTNPASATSDAACKADMRVTAIGQFCEPQEEGQSLMGAALTQLNLSARAYHRILKLTRAIADLVGSEKIHPPMRRRRCTFGRPKIMLGYEKEKVGNLL